MRKAFALLLPVGCATTPMRFKSRREAINDMRAVAAHFGADAVYEDRAAGPDTSLTLTGGAAPPRLIAIVWRR